jgi:adenylyl-sulfate kinase
MMSVKKVFVLWLTGLSGAGKTTLAQELQKQIAESIILDGDLLRSSLNKDLGFTDVDRVENIRRTGAIAQMLWAQEKNVIVALISPFISARAAVRSLFPKGHFIEIFVDCSLAVCQERDVKGLYKQTISQFTGIDSPYEVPQNPELVINTEKLSINDSVQKIMDYLKQKKFL